MDNMLNENRSSKWLSIPLIATVARILCRELTLQNEYLKQENKIYKSKINKRINFTDDERRILYSFRRKNSQNTTVIIPLVPIRRFV
jgi:hypothetical protein